MRTFAAALGAVIVAAAGVLVIPVAEPAGALEYEGITVGEGKPAKKTYGPIPGQNPLLVVDPESCPTEPWCAYVPLTIQYPPDFNPEGDDFTVTITLSWDDTDVEGNHSNDLDMYIWELPYDPDADPAEENVGQGASASNPEKAQIFRPTGGTYAILVNNFAGVNSGFTIEAEYLAYAIPPVFESLEPPTRPTSGEATEDRSGEPIPSLGGDLFDPVDELVPVPSLPLDVGSPIVAPDAALEFAAPPTADQIAAPPETLERSGFRPDPVSGATVALWLAATAVLFVAAAGVWLMRRRPAALRVA